MPAATTLGHVHLNVADLAATEAFYDGVLGFDVTTRAYPGALFLSAGGYHHHLGSNVWDGAGAPAPPAGALGLDAFEVVLPHTGALDQVLAAVADAGVPTVEDASGHGARRSVRQPPDPACGLSASRRVPVCETDDPPMSTHAPAAAPDATAPRTSAP